MRSFYQIKSNSNNYKGAVQNLNPNHIQGSIFTERKYDSSFKSTASRPDYFMRNLCNQQYDSTTTADCNYYDDYLYSIQDVDYLDHKPMKSLTYPPK